MRARLQRTRLALLATLLGLGTSCVNFDWMRDTSDKVITEAVTDGLAGENVELAHCLELLGAPHFVQEHRVHGLVLIYAWQRDRDLGLSVSVSIGDWNPSISYTDAYLRGKGLVLWFDEGYVLEKWQRGNLAEILSAKPPPPSSIEDIERT